MTHLRDRDDVVRWRAAKALGEIGDKQAVDLLIALLNDTDPNVRAAAAEALGKIGARELHSGLDTR